MSLMYGIQAVPKRNCKRSIIYLLLKNCSRAMKPVDVKEGHPSSNLFDRCYSITNEKLYQIIQNTSVEDFQCYKQP